MRGLLDTTPILFLHLDEALIGFLKASSTTGLANSVLFCIYVLLCSYMLVLKNIFCSTINYLEILSIKKPLPPVIDISIAILSKIVFQFHQCLIFLSKPPACLMLGRLKLLRNVVLAYSF